MDRG
jgi:hypothetical protein